MEMACSVMVVLLALASASRVSSLAAAGEQRGEDVLLHQQSVQGWRAAANETKLITIRGRPGRRGLMRKGAARCVPAAACRRRRVICGKRCYTAWSRLARVPPATRCVVVCKRCVPTC